VGKKSTASGGWFSPKFAPFENVGGIEFLIIRCCYRKSMFKDLQGFCCLVSGRRFLYKCVFGDDKRNINFWSDYDYDYDDDDDDDLGPA